LSRFDQKVTVSSVSTSAPASAGQITVGFANNEGAAISIPAYRYGAEAAAAAFPLRQILDAGIPVGAGTDATRPTSYNPWLSLYWMVTGRTIGGLQLLSKDNLVSREEALRLYTAGSAWFSGEEKLKGRIAPGQYADLAILSEDYFTVGNEDIRGIESVLTVTGGDIVHAAPPFGGLAIQPTPPVTPEWSPVGLFGGYQQQIVHVGS